MFSAFGAPRLDFYRFFDDPERHRKNNDFSNPQKSTKMAKSIDPGAPKVGFGSKNLYFWAPFWHRFFDFFRKRRKCVISEEYNAKRGSEPSKTFHFYIDFSSNFHVFPKPLPNSIFGGSKCPSILKSTFLDRSSILKWFQKRLLEHHFRPNKRVNEQ